MFWTIPKAVVLSLVAAVLVVLLSWSSFFDQVNNIGYDFTQRIAGGGEPETPVLIVAIDEASLDRVGRWPWPRTVLADLVRAVSAASPAAVGIDILMDDRTSGDADDAMAAALVQSRRVVLAASLDDTGPEPAWILPLPAFRNGVHSLAHVHAEPDLDGVMRRIVTAKHAGGRILSALSVETLRVAGRLPDRFEEDLGGSVRVVPEQVMIRFSGDRGTFPLVSAWQVLIGQVDPERFSDRIVMIGVTAEGLGDDWTTPVSTSGRRMSGIEVHANAIESIHSGLSVREVPGWIVLIGLAAVFILLRWVDRRFEGMRFYLVALATVPAAVAASAILMSAGYWLPFPTFLLGVGCVVPTLGVRKLVNVNRDLDQKISRLSVWGGEPLADDLALAGLRSQIDADIIDADIKDARLRLRWRGVLESCERERDGRARRRDGLLAKRRHNAGWKLEAVDFFSEQLHRFVTFNDAVLAGIEDVVIVADPAGQVVYQNTAAEKLRGFSISPPPMWDYLSSLLDRRDLKETFIRVVALSETVRVEKVASEGGSRYYALAIRPIPRIGAVATLVDVTAQHELDRAKNDMVSLVSHELRTPLTSIRGYGSMLARYGLVEEKGQEFLQAILDESARLNELIQSFLDVAAIESGTQKLEPTEFGTATLIDDVLSGLRPVAEPKAITLAKAVAADAGTILADRVLIFQAIVNLVSNAIKYSPPGTAVTVELERAAGQVRFRVVDQGHGIPGEDLRRVFEKFYRRSNDETRSEPGFGLGLSLVRQIAEQHGGGVGVDSAVGAGSVFTFWVPPSC